MRPNLLTRCFNRLLENSPVQCEWIIIDDAPEDGKLSKNFLSDLTSKAHFPVRYYKTNENIGRTAAANLGLKHAKGKYLHLHDDDDTVEPNFYKKTSEFLDINKDFIAVSTHAYRIDETRTHDTSWREVNRKIHNPNLNSFSLVSLATAFESPPICMLIRTDAANKIDGYNNLFDLGEDYDFALRLLVEGDIGVIPEPLCSVHRRAHLNEKSFDSNSHSENEQLEVESKIRNHYLRQDLKSGKFGMGFLLAMGEINSGSRKLNLIVKSLKRYKLLNWLRNKLRN